MTLMFGMRWQLQSLSAPGSGIASVFKVPAYLQIDFRLREPGLMKKFEGKWRIEPFNQASLDSNFGYKDQVNARHKLGFNPIAMIGTFGSSRLLSLMSCFPTSP